MAHFWLSERVGRMTPWSQAKAWGLAQAWEVMHPGTTHGRNTWIRDHVYVVTEDKRMKQHPSEQAIGQFLKKIEEDPSWFPGKLYGDKGGAPVQIPSVNKATMARSAMATKRKGDEPTYPNTLARNKRACINPVTGKEVSPWSVNKIFQERCYDEDPADKWKHLPRLAGKPLTEEEIRKRLIFGKLMEAKAHTPEWFNKHVVWTDICCDLKPLTRKKAKLQSLARKRGKGWQSKGCRTKSYNRKEDKGHLKIQQKKESRRVYWMPVLARGKLHVELLGSSFPGDKTEAMDEFVDKLKKVIRARFPTNNDQPNIVFVDRGEGFYKSNGEMTAEFGKALRRNGLKAFHGRSAECQPGRSGDLWLHETTVSWIRERMKKTQPVEPWKESEDDLGKRLKAAAAHCTSEHEVTSLCREFPQRMHDLVHVTKGDRLSK